MIIKPYKNDLWFYCKQPKVGDVDRADIYFGKEGEFSEYSDEAFEKHLSRLDKLAHNPYYYKFNGSRLKEIAKNERLWYGNPGK